MPQSLLIVSNRGPVTYSGSAAEGYHSKRGSGGLVTALSSLMRSYKALWLASALSPADHELAARGETLTLDDDGLRCRVKFVSQSPEVYQKFYNVVANPLLWFCQHYLWNLSYAPIFSSEEWDAWEQGYLVANKAFAQEISGELLQNPEQVVMLHDYHFYTCPSVVRELHPDSFLHHFIHIPWPASDAWDIFPRAVRKAIFNGMLANDIVAFHTASYVRNFLVSAEEVAGVEVDYKKNMIHTPSGRTIWVRNYPISVDPKEFDLLAGSQEVLKEEEALARQRKEFLLLRVDRLDLSKNILRGFLAYELFLTSHPEFCERVTFLALLQPSREDVEEYREYRVAVEQMASAINKRVSRPGWQPIDLRIGDNFTRSVAAYKQYDALMVNAIYDGMNLIAKEASLVNRRSGVLILSENTGAYEELGPAAVGVNPFDLEGQAEAIYQAFSMDSSKRRKKSRQLQQIVHDSPLEHWIKNQLADIESKRSESKASSLKG